jgi:hypothetical protein
MFDWLYKAFFLVDVPSCNVAKCWTGRAALLVHVVFIMFDCV